MKLLRVSYCLGALLFVMQQGHALDIDAYSYDKNNDYTNALYAFCEQQWQDKSPQFESLKSIKQSFFKQYYTTDLSVLGILGDVGQSLQDHMTLGLSAAVGLDYIYPTYLVLNSKKDMQKITPECIYYYIAGRRTTSTYTLTSLKEDPTLRDYEKVFPINEAKFYENAAAKYSQDQFYVRLHNQSERFIKVDINSNNASAGVNRPQFFPEQSTAVQASSLAIGTPTSDTMIGYNNNFSSNLIALNWYNVLDPKSYNQGALLSLFNVNPSKDSLTDVKYISSMIVAIPLCIATNYDVTSGKTVKPKDCGKNLGNALMGKSNIAQQNIKDRFAKIRSLDLKNKEKYTQDLTGIKVDEAGNYVSLIKTPVVDPKLFENATANTIWINTIAIGAGFTEMPVLVLEVLNEIANVALDVGSNYINMLNRGNRQVSLYQMPYDNAGKTDFLDNPEAGKDKLCVAKDYLVLGTQASYQNNALAKQIAKQVNDLSASGGKYMGSSVIDLYIDDQRCGGQYDYSKALDEFALPQYKTISAAFLDYLIANKMVSPLFPNGDISNSISVKVNGSNKIVRVTLPENILKNIITNYTLRGIPLFARYYSGELIIYAATEAVQAAFQDPLNSTLPSILSTTASNISYDPNNINGFVQPVDNSSNSLQMASHNLMYYRNINAQLPNKALDTLIGGYFDKGQTNVNMTLSTNATDSDSDSNATKNLALKIILGTGVTALTGTVTYLAIKVVKYRMLQRGFRVYDQMYSKELKLMEEGLDGLYPNEAELQKLGDIVNKMINTNSLDEAANAASDGEKIIERYAGKSSPVDVSKTLDKYEKILNKYQADLGQIGQKYGELPAYQALSDKLGSAQKKVADFWNQRKVAYTDLQQISDQFNSAIIAQKQQDLVKLQASLKANKGPFSKVYQQSIESALNNFKTNMKTKIRDMAGFSLTQQKQLVSDFSSYLRNRDYGSFGQELLAKQRKFKIAKNKIDQYYKEIQKSSIYKNNRTEFDAAYENAVMDFNKAVNDFNINIVLNSTQKTHLDEVARTSLLQERKVVEYVGGYSKKFNLAMANTLTSNISLRNTFSNVNVDNPIKILAEEAGYNALDISSIQSKYDMVLSQSMNDIVFALVEQSSPTEFKKLRKASQSSEEIGKIGEIIEKPSIGSKAPLKTLFDNKASIQDLEKMLIEISSQKQQPMVTKAMNLEKVSESLESLGSLNDLKKLNY
ncbi:MULTISPECIES: hypothetical protein [Cysteiniphilum]|uniref:hypothetical protein n=1 Tax=Cysteiniphilum TaxID=2056696 RepID=UPI00177FB2A6|nr:MULTISPECIES: hypothetical protein [Cysteiniphilum]